MTATERWAGSRSDPRTGNCDYKNVRFRLARSSVVSHGWSFRPFGREARDFATWEEAVVALEQTCTTIAQQREEGRSR